MSTGRRQGLWEWTPHGAERTDVDNPRTRPCPTCNAPITRPCVRRARGRLVEMTSYHPARKRPSTEDT